MTVVRGEEGQVGGAEALVFGVLVFVLGTLVVANAWGVVDAKMAAGAAAREATRAFVESDASSIGEAFAEAEDAARVTVAGAGRDPSKLSVIPERISRRRCAAVTVRTEYPVPLLSLPVIGAHGHGFTAVGRHTEIVDPYRGGLDDRGACPAEMVGR
ncbi:MAG TPA: hypothetical protein VM143_16230 [Acidimicrobiales bacterium]|nr:hypothetical protein [Acidimicrobiales bacterium]